MTIEEQKEILRRAVEADIVVGWNYLGASRGRDWLLNPANGPASYVDAYDMHAYCAMLVRVGV